MNVPLHSVIQQRTREAGGGGHRDNDPVHRQRLRLYVGNIPRDSSVSERELVDWMNSRMEQAGVEAAEGG